MKSVKKKKISSLENSLKIKTSTEDSLQHLLEIFRTLKNNRKGSPTDKEQDLLRAVVVLGCAGLDSFLKQIINDTLNLVRKNNKYSQRYFINKTKDILQDSKKENIDLQLMSEILMSGNTEETLARIIMERMSEKSLQNFGELQEIARAFGMSESIFSDKKTEIRHMFNSRNKIAHEFDYNFKEVKNNQGQKVREQRKKEDIEKMVETINFIMSRLKEKVEEVLLV